jgi:hypothetical protein
MINVATRVENLLETTIALPPTRNRWSRRATAAYLKTQGLLGGDKATIGKWEILLRIVKDFRTRIPKDTAYSRFMKYSSSNWQTSFVGVQDLLSQVQ